jgi:predicted nucleic-acid-binding Zn-ribbon protein
MQQLPSITPCPQCGGQRVGMGCSADTLLTRGNRFSGASVTGLKALVCLACGYTMFYAENLSKIQEEIRKHPGDFKY